MSRRTLHLVLGVEKAGPPDPDIDVVVLDSSWTPAPGDRTDIAPIRPRLQAVLDRVDLFDGSLERLDTWAEAAGLADRLVVNGVTWWFRIRMVVRWDLHERMLWRHVLGDLLSSDSYARIVVPAERRALVDVARAAGSASAPIEVIEVSGPDDPDRPDPIAESPPPERPSEPSLTFAERIARKRRRLVRRLLRRPPPPGPRKLAAQRRAETIRERLDHLDARVRTLAAQPGGVMAIASANFFQVLGDRDHARFVDPHLALVLDRLEAEGTTVATAVLALDHRREDDWARIEADPQTIPDSYIRARWGTPEQAPDEAPEVTEHVSGIADVPLDLDGWDLGPAMASIVAEQVHTFVPSQVRWMTLAEHLLRELRPSVVLVDHEGVRTLWLAAAKRLGIPVVAVQHGVIYSNNPEFCHPVHPNLIRPDMTCVYGRYERDVLVNGGGYDPASVIVTGSSRADPDAQTLAGSPTERADVRRELGVRERDLMIVVSVAHNPVMGDVHSVCMVARALGGPLPEVHVVFKLHPQERSDPPYERVLRGLAAAGDYEPPAMTSVRDIDLYRLLRSADAHLGQYSTVITDAAVAGTPTLLAVGQAYADMLGYVPAGVATPIRGVDDVRAALRAGVTLDPEARRRFLADHYEPGDATGRIVAAIRTIAG